MTQLLKLDVNKDIWYTTVHAFNILQNQPNQTWNCSVELTDRKIAVVKVYFIRSYVYLKDMRTDLSSIYHHMILASPHLIERGEGGQNS